MFTRKAPPIDSRHSISKLMDIQLGNIKQWIYLRGADRNNPVLLMLHGGPGAAQIGFIRKFQQELEEHFVVVNWDQRGAGLSFSKNIPVETMNIHQFVEDTIQLTTYLQNRFQQERIYLLGHSWGTIIGMLAAARAPERYIRYFGVAQVSNVEIGDKLSYEGLLKKAKLENNQKAYEDLVAIGPPPWGNLKQDRVHQKYLEVFGGGITRDGKLVGTIIKEMLRSKEYTLLDVVRHFRGQMFSMKMLQDEMRKTDLKERINRFEIPVYFCMGRHDLTTPYEPAEAFFNSLEAPEKHWIWFENSAHSPSLEEKEKFVDLVVTETRKDR